MKKFVISCLIFTILAATSCKANMATYDKLMKEEFPYGEWVSESGYTLRVLKDDTYEIKYEGESNKGSLKWETPREDGMDAGAPYLYEFDQKPIALEMMKKSGYYDRQIEKNPDSVKFPSLYPNVGKGNFFTEHCKNRPCRHFGGLERPEYAFYMKEN